MNLHLPQTEEARAEALILMEVNELFHKNLSLALF
jgi:DNA-directed RNA polymerase beta' subunit